MCHVDVVVFERESVLTCSEFSSEEFSSRITKAHMVWYLGVSR